MTPLHFSVLKEMRRSPAHAKFRLDNPEGDATSSTQVGSAAHSLALGKGKRVVVCEMRRDKRVEAYRNFLADNGDAIILSPAEYAKATGIAKALKQNDQALYYLDGVRELPMEWSWMGRACRTRGIDVVDTGAISGIRFITELKSTKFAKPEWFQTEVLRRSYNAQLVFYEQALGIDIPELVIVAVESAPPHPVVVYRLSDRMREQARKQLHLWMELFLSCEKSNQWPGYAQSVIELDIANDAELDFTDVDEAEGF